MYLQCAFYKQSHIKAGRRRSCIWFEMCLWQTHAPSSPFKSTDAQTFPQAQCLYPICDLSASPSHQSFSGHKGTPENLARVRFPTSLYSLRSTHCASSPTGPLVITCYGNRGMFQVLGFSLHCTVSLSNDSLSTSIYYLLHFSMNFPKALP